MPETRKHTRVPRDELDRAILAAMGEDPRPLPAGEAHRVGPREGERPLDARAAGPGSDQSLTSPDTVEPRTLPTTTLGSFSFRAQPPPAPEDQQ